MGISFHEESEEYQHCREVLTLSRAWGPGSRQCSPSQPDRRFQGFYDLPTELSDLRTLFNGFSLTGIRISRWLAPRQPKFRMHRDLNLLREGLLQNPRGD